ncbi:MAG TPA: hypothetical protein DD435_10085, partial [Cyanobacteria bacterium UBA8530]|nr:hypothetical protein [Cyanobacteria bacterium UBA8530]
MRRIPALIALSIALTSCDGQGLSVVVQPNSKSTPDSTPSSTTVVSTPNPTPFPVVDRNQYPAYYVAAELAPLANKMGQTGYALGEASKAMAAVPGSAPSFGMSSMKTLATYGNFPFTFEGEGKWLMKNDNGVVKFTVELNFHRAQGDSLIREDLFDQKNYFDFSTFQNGPLFDLLRQDRTGLDFSKLNMKVTDLFDPFTVEGTRIDLGNPATEVIPFTPNGPASLNFSCDRASFTLPDGTNYVMSNLIYTVEDIIDGGTDPLGYHDFSQSRCAGSFDFSVTR